MSYEEYLTARLCSIYLLSWEDMAYDEEFVEARKVFKKYQKWSEKNENIGLYQDLENFITDILKPQDNF